MEEVELWRKQEALVKACASCFVSRCLKECTLAVRYGSTYRRSTQAAGSSSSSSSCSDRIESLLQTGLLLLLLLLRCCCAAACSDAQQVKYKLDLIHLTSPGFFSSSASSYLHSN
jgi:hypothetical protein